MHRNFRLKISILFILLSFFYFLTIKNVIVEACDLNLVNNNTNLVLDSLKHDEMPKNFRKSSDSINIQNNKNLNTSGLDTLNISGSEQFSGYNLPLLINSIGTSLPITVMDLRQESHGFINGYPVSWANLKNNANLGLTKEQVLSDENSKLNSIKLNIPVTFHNHPNITIIPMKVSSENQLVNSKSLSYIRIPVTDGKLPTDDMVNYFIELVKSKPKNTWFHFHCKRGMGRTTTFMIMYDMIKNSKEVTADDIIKRELQLANFDENQIKSFYNNERSDFLQNFYKYCKENGDNFNVKWSDWKKAPNTNSNSFFTDTSVLKNTSEYIKNLITPNYLYVISQDSMTPGERTMIATLQGLVNSHCSFQIYTLNSKQPDYQIWLDNIKNSYGISYKSISDPWQLLGMFKNYVDGYVLYNNKSLNDPSINNACTFASLNNCIAVDEAIQDKVRAYGITKLKCDCRNTDEKWAYNNLWNSGLNHSMIIQLSPDKDTALRDYGIMTKALIFYEDSIKDTALRDKIFSSMERDSICLGWGPDEFIMSDGDNLQWNLGTNYGSPKWYGSPHRGSFNLGWSLSPALYYLAPTVFNLYYKNAAHGSNNDYFIVSPSGNGYMYPSKFDKNTLGIYINRLNDYIKKVDEKYIAIIDDSSFHNKELWDKFTIKSNIQGLFYLDYHRHDNYHVEIIWSNNKPIVSCRDLLWDNLENKDELVENINHRTDSGQVDIHNPNSYTFVYVHAWSKSLSNVEDVVTKLKKNSKVTIVTPETFMKLIKRNVKH